MASERKWFTVSQLFTADGTTNGKITVADVTGFYVKSQVRIISNTQNAILLEVKRIEGTTDIYVGPIGQDIESRISMSSFLVADLASITLHEQKIPTIKQEDIWQAIYAREPIVALRNVLVDKYGRYYDSSNPLPINATISGDVYVDIDALTPTTSATPDNVLVVGTDGINKGNEKFPFVNNRRLQILAAKDRQMSITYADFGTKNQRVTQIDYVAPSIGTGVGFTARKIISYTLVGTRYRRDTVDWLLV